MILEVGRAQTQSDGVLLGYAKDSFACFFAIYVHGFELTEFA